jgi:hypothetical protein
MNFEAWTTLSPTCQKNMNRKVTIETPFSTLAETAYASTQDHGN